MGKHKGGKGGVIVNIASILGLDYSPWIPTYTATKHGIIGFGKSYGVRYINMQHLSTDRKYRFQFEELK